MSAGLKHSAQRVHAGLQVFGLFLLEVRVSVGVYKSELFNCTRNNTPQVFLNSCNSFFFNFSLGFSLIALIPPPEHEDSGRWIYIFGQLFSGG